MEYTKIKSKCEYKVPDKVKDKIKAYLLSLDKHSWNNQLKLASFLTDHLPQEIIMVCNKIGTGEREYSLIIINNLFDDLSEYLGLLLHETISSYICGIKDIVYEYEKHKFIYPKDEGVQIREWGNGYGSISPHSDDLYENIGCDLLSLTLFRCEKDKLTSLYCSEKLISTLSDVEINILLTQHATFTSGKNVNGVIITKDNYILRKHGRNYLIRLDFRIEGNRPRMYSKNIECQLVIDKLRKNLLTECTLESEAKKGSFIILDNEKVLHGRKSELSKVFLDKSRLLFRSKGQKYTMPKAGS